MNQTSRSDAQAIWAGACNPRSISRAIVRAADAAADETGTTNETMRNHEAWAPVRIMVAQLHFLLGMGIGDYDRVDEDAAALQESAEEAWAQADQSAS